MEKFVENLRHKIQFKIKELQWSIDYFREDLELVKDEIRHARSQISGLRLADELIDEVLKDLEHQEKFNEFVDGMNAGLDKINEIISRQKS